MQRSDKVEAILAKNEKSRYDDKHLYIQILKEYCKTDTEFAVIERVINEAPGQAHIVRARAFYQNELGLYLPPEEFISGRRRKAIKIRNEIRNLKKEQATGLFDAVARWFKS